MPTCIKCPHSRSTKLPKTNLSRLVEGIRNSLQRGDKDDGGEEFHISLVDDAKPFCVNTPRSIPFAYREKLRAELDLLQKQGIIALVTEPTEWYAPIVITPKKISDRIRLCVDLSRLNRYVRRERYQSSSQAQAVADIAADKAKVFTTLDAMKGYHQCPLDKESQNLTTFITPFGRFKFLRAPYGISSISEHYNRRMDEAFQDYQAINDVVIYDDNLHITPTTSDSSLTLRTRRSPQPRKVELLSHQ